MSAVEQAQQINADIKGWLDMENHARSAAVIDWCKKQSIDVRITARQLSAAMNFQKYWTQGPDDYLDMVQSFTAAMKAA